MSFATIGLGFLALIVGGLFVYTLHALKPRRHQVTVSSAMLWDRQEIPATSAVPWQTPANTRLFIARVAGVVALAFLFSGPVSRAVSPFEEHTVVIVDVSASMGAIDGQPDRLSDAQAIALEIVEDIPDSGRISLIAAGQDPRIEVSATSDLDSFRSAVQALRVTDGAADVAGALRIASGLDRPDAPIGVVLVSDGIHNDLPESALPDGFTHRQVGSAAVNHALTDLAVEQVDTGLLVTASSEVFGGSAVTTTLRLDVDGLTQAVLDVTIEPGEPTITQVALPPGEQVIARLGGDDLLASDNTRYVTTRAQNDLFVSVVGETTPFVEALLNVVPGVTVVDPDSGQGEITIFSGGVVPDDVDRPFLAIAPSSGAPGVAVVDAVEEPALSFTQGGDPLLTGLDLSDLRVTASQAVQSATGETLIDSDAGPLLIRGGRAGIPYLYLSFALEQSSLPVDVAFPVLGQRILEELSGSVRVPVSLEVGEQLTPPAGQPVTVTAPSGTQLDRAAGEAAVTVDRPGFWTLTSTSGATRTVSVNVARAESSLSPERIIATTPRPGVPGAFSPFIDSPMLWPYVLLAIGIGIFEFFEARKRKAIPRTQWWLANLLRVTAGILLGLTLLGWTVERSSDDVATVFVLDRSDSVGANGAAAAQELLDAAISEAPGGTRVGIVAVGAGAQVEQGVVSTGDENERVAAVVEGGQTDLAAGLDLAGAILPEDTKRRVVVVSDGRATSTGAEQAARALGEDGVAVDYILLDSAPTADAAVVAITAPPSVDEESLVGVEVSVESTTAGPATVTIRRDDEIVGFFDVELDAGISSVSFIDDPGTTGVFEYSATVDFPGDQIPENDSARSTVDVAGEARVLVVEGTAAGGDDLASALQSTGITVDVIAAEELPGVDRLVDYDSVILVNVALIQLTDSQVESIVIATRELGTGLLTIGGPQSFGLGGYRHSELETVIPVTSEITDPSRQRQVAQVLALDTSASMGECHCDEGDGRGDVDNVIPENGGLNKTTIARAGAAQALQNLTANDEVGILAVDTLNRWVVDFGELPPQDVIDAGLATIRPFGDTELRNTLPTAANALRESEADLKHVIFFTDGFQGRGIEVLAEQAAELLTEGITTSLVATGEGAVEELRVIAEAGGGRFYAGRDLTRIPDILVQESQLASSNFIQEGEFLPVVSDATPLADALEASPPLLGYVVTTPKPTSRTTLRIGEDGDPLLTSWQVGLGRSTAWTSDASVRWSQQWADWDGYVDFWTGVVRDTFPVEEDGVVRSTIDGDTLTIRAEAAPGQTRLDATISTPDGLQRDVTLREIAPGVFEGIATVDSPGNYAIGVSSLGSSGSVAVGSDVAAVSYSAEYRPGQPDEATLARLSELTGGRGAIEATTAFDGDDLEAGMRTQALTIPLLILGMAAWLAAIALSRLWFGRPALLSDAPKAPRRWNPRGWGPRGWRPALGSLSAS